MTDKEKFDKLKCVTDEFIKFIHDSYGFYWDSVQGYKLHKDDMQRKFVNRIDDILDISNSDPDDPNALILHRASVSDIITRNTQEGENVKTLRSQLIVMISDHWNSHVRKDIAGVLGVKRNEVESDIMGDITKIRNDILKDRGRVNKSLGNKIITFKKDDKINISSEIFDKIFKEIFKWLRDLFNQESSVNPYPDDSLNQEAKAVHRSMKHTVIRGQDSP